MNSPSTLPSVLKTKNSPNVSTGMSTSLKERLKKCGRYHPGNSSRDIPTNTSTLTERKLYSPDSTTVRDLSVSIQINQTTFIDKQDGETPKRRTSEALKDTTVKNSTEVIKRRKLDYTNRFIGENSLADQLVDLTLPSLSSPQQLKNSPKLEGLRENGDETNENLLYSGGPDHNQTVYGVISCAGIKGSGSSPESSSQDQNYDSLKDLKLQLERDLKVKEEQRRKLKMVKMYREKNNLEDLQRLINTWRDASQRALVDLYDLHPPPRPSMTELINHLQIDHELIQFVVEDEGFS